MRFGKMSDRNSHDRGTNRCAADATDNELLWSKRALVVVGLISVHAPELLVVSRIRSTAIRASVMGISVTHFTGTHLI